MPFPRPSHQSRGPIHADSFIVDTGGLRPGTNPGCPIHGDSLIVDTGGLRPGTNPGCPIHGDSLIVDMGGIHRLSPNHPSQTHPAAQLRTNRQALAILKSWATELTQVRILDPACGSGNFLYLALKRLLDLWQMARQFGIDHGVALAVTPSPAPSSFTV